MDEDFITLRVDRRDAGRILSGLRERRRKLQKGVEKFGSDFDPVKGRNMVEGLEAYTDLINIVKGHLANA